MFYSNFQNWYYNIWNKFLAMKTWKNCPPDQNQPKSQFLFDKNCSTRELLCIMTLGLGGAAVPHCSAMSVIFLKTPHIEHRYVTKRTYVTFSFSMKATTKIYVCIKIIKWRTVDGKGDTPSFPPILLNMAILQSRIIIINLEIEGLTYEKEIQKKYWIFTVVTLKDLSGIVLFLWSNIIIIWIFVWQCLSKVGFRIWNLKEKTATNKNIWFDCQYSSR